MEVIGEAALNDRIKHALSQQYGPSAHPDIIVIQTAGWLNKNRDLKKDPITDTEKAMLKRVTSDKGSYCYYYYYGLWRFFILFGKAFAETMLELLKK